MAKEKDKSKPKVVKMTDAEEKKKHRCRTLLSAKQA